MYALCKICSQDSNLYFYLKQQYLKKLIIDISISEIKSKNTLCFVIVIITFFQQVGHMSGSLCQNTDYIILS